MSNYPCQPCSTSKLMDGSVVSTATYLAKMKRLINEELGDGFAEKNPDLLGQSLIACAIEFQSGYYGQKFDEFTNGINRLADVVDSLFTEGDINE